MCISLLCVLLQKQLKSCQDLDKLLYFSDEKKPCNNNMSVILDSEPNRLQKLQVRFLIRHYQIDYITSVNLNKYNAFINECYVSK